jgi:hypothetical protein
MERVSLDRPVLTGFLLGIGLGFALMLWESVRWVLSLDVDLLVVVAFCGVALLVILLWVIALAALARGRKSRAASTRRGSG